ncbi:MAG: TolC family outer membrane protein [Pseudomonadota bacterium]
MASVVLIVCFSAVLSSSVSAITLREAFAAAYAHNASLQAERFKTRATDDGVSRALSGYRPRVNADAFYGGASPSQTARTSTSSFSESYGYGVTIEQPLFDGFKTHYSVQEAEATVRASREELKAAENEILFQTASAYMDVLRDEGINLYRRKTLSSLKRFLLGIEEQFEREQVTQTDVEQARLRVATAKSDVDGAKAQLRISQLRFVKVTQRAADDLRMPALPVALPNSLESANELARHESPIIAAATEQHEAATQAVQKIRGELLPQAGLVAGYDKSFNDAETSVDRDGFSVFGRVRVPLYQGGEVSARIRQAKNTAAGRNRETHAAVRRIDEAVGAAWAEFRAANAKVSSDKLAVGASERALTGVRDEQEFGRRTVLDVLDAERELINARIRLLESTRDQHVAAYLLLRSTGQLTIERMAPGTDQYDPRTYYAQVRDTWGGTTTPEASAGHFLGANETGEAIAIGGRGNVDRPNGHAVGWSAEVHRVGAQGE